VDPGVEIVCFHVPPEQWLGWRWDAIGVYQYLREKAQDRVSVVSLSEYKNKDKALSLSH
jgi:hypothetical protein